MAFPAADTAWTAPAVTLPPAPACASSAEDAAQRIDRHLPMLWRYLRMHGAPHQQAEDLAQEAFVVALRKGALASAPAATAAFLCRTARFLLLRARKAERSTRLLADAVDGLWTRDCAADGGDGLLAAARDCVGQLEGRARRAIELAYGFGRDAVSSRAAIARELEMRENGIKTLLQRTRQRLRECIARKTGKQEP